MGVGNLAAVAERLIAAGRSARTPVAIVQNATRPDQRTVTATLATAAEEAAKANVRPPAVVIVGEVVAMRERIAWLEKLPLWGRTVLVTRARQQASRLAQRLGELGANVIECPSIEVHPPADWGPVDGVLRRLNEYDWLVLTSPNGAAALVERVRAIGLDARALGGVRIAAVGPATAEVLRDHFLQPGLVPPEFTTEALGEALAAEAGGRRFLLARADIATDALPEAIRAAGGSVEQVTIYRTTRPAALPDEALAALRDGRADWITFTSSSTVENFLALLAGQDVSLTHVKLASIGPVTSDALRAHGLAPTVTAETHTIDSLVEALARPEATR
jgi:uroporphyrinogen III methyltransferase/synthase